MGACVRGGYCIHASKFHNQATPWLLYTCTCCTCMLHMLCMLLQYIWVCMCTHLLDGNTHVYVNEHTSKMGTNKSASTRSSERRSTGPGSEYAKKPGRKCTPHAERSCDGSHAAPCGRAKVTRDKCAAVRARTSSSGTARAPAVSPSRRGPEGRERYVNNWRRGERYEGGGSTKEEGGGRRKQEGRPGGGEEVLALQSWTAGIAVMGNEL